MQAEAALRPPLACFQQECIPRADVLNSRLPRRPGRKPKSVTLPSCRIIWIRAPRQVRCDSFARREGKHGAQPWRTTMHLRTRTYGTSAIPYGVVSRHCTTSSAVVWPRHQVLRMRRLSSAGILHTTKQWHRIRGAATIPQAGVTPYHIHHHLRVATHLTQPNLI